MKAFSYSKTKVIYVENQHIHKRQVLVALKLIQDAMNCHAMATSLGSLLALDCVAQILVWVQWTWRLAGSVGLGRSIGVEREEGAQIWALLLPPNWQSSSLSPG